MARGKEHRKDALALAIADAKRNFATRFGKAYDVPTTIDSGYPSGHVGLQIVDYYLWALQRMYETNKARFFELLAPSYRVVMDLDDKRRKSYGEWYSEANLLTAEKIKTL
jgi:hypothetical protein